MLPAELERRLQSCAELPRPPGVAVEIIALANDPDTDIDRVAKVLAVDPATTAKILRAANSPLYAMHRSAENLRQALLVLGLNVTISLALSFSVLKFWQSGADEGGIDYARYWRRALLAATASRALAKVLGIKDAEELFLTSLIQDIGLMALDRAVPGLYAGIGADQAREANLIARERDSLGVDHGAVGGWLLDSWAFPARVREAVAASHCAERVSMQTPEGRFTRCVAVSSMFAEAFLEDRVEPPFQALAAAAKSWLEIESEALGELIADVAAMIPDVEAVFQTRILGKSRCDGILDEARESLLLRDLALETAGRPPAGADSPLWPPPERVGTAHRDVLTGLHDRAYLDDYVKHAFDEANRSNTALSVAVSDVDRLKSINDGYGRGAGDQILVATANLLKANVRGTDIVARYGGEELVLVFPETGYLLVKLICERIVESFRATTHDVGGPRNLVVTISLGMATHNDGRVFASALELIRAADRALHAAKLQGRDRSVPYEAIASSPVGQL